MTPQTDKHLRPLRTRRCFVAVSAGALAAVGAGLAPTAVLGAEARVFHLPAESLAQALVHFAVQGGVSVGGLPAQGCDGRSRAVSGAMAPAAALAALLPAGCGFEAVDAHSFRVLGRPSPPPVPMAQIARSEPAAVSVARLDELVVTAEKRPELLTRSASAVSVLSAGDAAALGGKSFDELAAQVVGVAVTNLGSGRNKIFVRGLSDGSFTGKTQSTVGLYLGDVPITYNAPDPDLRLADIDRVEVLRGPQGTLYGSGSMGGIVRIVPARPDAKGFSAALSVEGMLTQHGDPSSGVEGMVNLPLAGGRAAVRAVAYSDQRGGYIDNPLLGLSDVNFTRRSGGRVAGLAALAGGWTVEAGLAHQTISTADSQYTQGPGGPLTRSVAVREPHVNKFSEASVTASHSGDVADLKISVAYIDHRLTTLYDATGSFRTGEAPTVVQAFDEDKHNRIWAAEGLLSSNAPGPLRWLAGAFVSYTDERDTALLEAVRPTVRLRSIYSRQDQLTEAALYGEVAYDLSPRITVTLGGRAFATRVDMDAGDFGLAQAPLAPTQGRLTDQGAVPKVRISYAATRDIVVYAQVQEGYRAGGFNIPSAAGGSATPEPVAAQFRPDHLWNYELGVGAPFFDHTLVLRGALFHADWRALQTDQRLATGLPMTVNIGDGSNTGIEGELTWRPDTHWQVRANLLLEDPSITRAANVFPARRDIGLPGVPYDMGATDLRYRWTLGRFNAEASAQVVYVGRSFLTFDGGTGNAMGGYASGRIAGGISTAAWRATAYVDNVADERGNTFAYGNPFSRARASQATPLRPRTLGMELSRSF